MSKSLEFIDFLYYKIAFLSYPDFSNKIQNENNINNN